MLFIWFSYATIFYCFWCGSSYGDIPLFLLTAISGCGIILIISVIISRLFEVNEESKIKKAVLWIGQNTIGIFLLHKPTYQDIILKGLNSLGFVEPKLIVAIVGAIIVLPICVLLILLVDKFLPQSLGKKAIQK